VELGRQNRLFQAPVDLLDPLRNPPPMHRLELQRLQDEHVERALNKIGRLIGHLVHLPLDCREKGLMFALDCQEDNDGMGGLLWTLLGHPGPASCRGWLGAPRAEP